MSSHRLLRVRELLRREIGEAIRRELPVEQAGLITVNEVDVTGDLRLATVYIGIFGSSEQQKAGWQMLQRYRARIQSLVAQSVILKYVPQLRFVIDDSIARGNKVLDILAELDRSAPNA
jgi:ribosome-binding factor A